MLKVKRELDSQVKDIQAEGRTLQDHIDTTSKQMRLNMLAWQKDQEQYQHQLHSELLLLNDTKQNITYLNEQIRLLIILQKKTKVSQAQISKEIKQAYKDISKLKGTVVIEELENHQADGKDRKAAKS